MTDQLTVIVGNATVYDDGHMVAELSEEAVETIGLLDLNFEHFSIAPHRVIPNAIPLPPVIYKKGAPDGT